MTAGVRGPAPAGLRPSFTARAHVRTALQIGAAVLVGGLLAACAQPMPPPAVETPPPSSGLASPPRPTPTPFTGERADLPDDFPVPPDAVALPLPPETAVIGRWRMPGFGRLAYDFYLEALRAAGYPITGTAPGGGVAIIRLEAAPGVVWQLEITGDLESTVIELWPERQ